uniref:SEC63 domain-containing protein n=1 Tax=Picea sitchensis TaxID=3332 RepID=D5ACR9_PICSI|nr:unknown [Picea sitchensis]
MYLMQMVLQGLWFEKDPSLLMLPNMNDNLIKILQQNGITQLKQLFEYPKPSLQRLLQSILTQPKLSELLQALERFPQIQMKCNLQKTESSREQNLYLLEIKLRRTKSGSRAFAPRFPKIKDEAWWLVLGNTKTWELYALKRISFSDHLTTSMVITPDQMNLEGTKLLLVSDCYLGFEQQYTVHNNTLDA